MSAIDKTTDETKLICWARGDTAPRIFNIGNGSDISSNTYRLTVNTEPNPSVALPGTVLFTASGVLVDEGGGAGVTGLVSFAPSPAGWADAIAELPTRVFYDLEQITPAVDTLIKGPVDIEQDISK